MNCTADADGYEAVATVQAIAALPTILDVVCRTTGMGFAAVARVTDTRWIACGVRDTIDFGLKPGGELQLATTLCDEIRQSGEAVVIDDVSENPAYCGHPTPALYGFQSYISMPIVLRDGRFFGTLCAIDPRPHRVNTPEIVGMFRLFAELIAFHLDAHDYLSATSANLRNERRTSQLRDQFIAVLGHDLRNPLAAIDAGARLLAKRDLDDPSKRIVGEMQSSVGRMARLIDNVLDFARGRLGGGVAVTRRAAPLEPALRHVVAEMRASHPGRAIDEVYALQGPVDCDPDRVAQLLSNLLGNAVTHGAADRPIEVRARSSAGALELEVVNGGDPIPAEAMRRLFEPFERGAVRPDAEGLGLGLYIAREIARAHGGTLEARSTPRETAFTFSIPLKDEAERCLTTSTN
ncbi:MAG: histidine kinase [Caulobacteraceae bacterium]|jgi:signal transduction histidine kinase|nr:histidine kinase [Caulobacteraceae bacterium]